MAGLFSLGRPTNSDPMRESAAMTTVYLLEWNQKFEQFLRVKVGELEARVAAQQARLSTKEEKAEREIWADDLTYLDGLGDEFAALEPEEQADLAQPSDPPPGVELSSLDDYSASGAIEAASDISGEALEEELPDYIGLMGAGPEDTEGQNTSEPPDSDFLVEDQPTQSGDDVIARFDDTALEISNPDTGDDFWDIDSDDEPETVASFFDDKFFSDETHAQNDEFEAAENETGFDEEAGALPADTETHSEDDEFEAAENETGFDEEAETFPTDTEATSEDDEFGAAEEEAETFPTDTEAHAEDDEPARQLLGGDRQIPDISKQKRHLAPHDTGSELSTRAELSEKPPGAIDEWETELPDTTPEDYAWVDSD